VNKIPTLLLSAWLFEHLTKLKATELMGNLLIARKVEFNVFLPKGELLFNKFENAFLIGTKNNV